MSVIKFFFLLTTLCYIELSPILRESRFAAGGLDLTIQDHKCQENENGRSHQIQNDDKA